MFKNIIVRLIDCNVGRYPSYIISLEIAALIGCFILYMPFAKREKQLHKESLGS